jgi:hypothetical protein
MNPNHNLDAWQNRVAVLRNQIQSLFPDAQEALQVPAGGTHEQRLAAFLEIWALFQIPSPAIWTDFGKALSDNVMITLNPDKIAIIAKLMRLFAAQLDAAISKALENVEAVPDGLIHTSDFGENGVFHRAGAGDNAVYGRLESLPVGHKLRELFPAEKCLLLNNERVIVLGRLAHLTQPVVRAWFDVPTARTLTEQHRVRQQHKDDEEAERKRWVRSMVPWQSAGEAGRFAAKGRMVGHLR